MIEPSFYWHDYETFGTDSRRDRPSQFAGQRTTIDLQPIGEPLTVYCKPAPDILPSPMSCLITGITPQFAERNGIIEADFAAQIHEELAQPGTCGVGYNSLRFDDEFTRNLLYRNFYDPYAREWENGSSRWDIIDLARMCCALRPQGIEWPTRDDGAVSFRLEDLTAANRLAHENAHDALSDVHATIGLAQLLRSRQPRLFEFYFGLRRKRRAFEFLDYVNRTPVLHVSSRYPASRGCLAMVVPLTPHPQQPSNVIVYDLAADPTPLLELDVDEIADRVFTARADLPEDVERIPLKTVHANRSPALAPLSVLAGVDTARIALDIARCMANLERLRDTPEIAEKIRRVFSKADDDDRIVDAELSLYRGFLGDADRDLLRAVRVTSPKDLSSFSSRFADARYKELLFRYRARNWPQVLNATESETWIEHCADRLRQGISDGAYFEEIRSLREIAGNDAAQLAILDHVERWSNERLREFNVDSSTAPAMPL